MKKIGIITFHAAYNYGSALQATALQVYLENCGYKVDILNFFDKLDMRQYKLFRTHYYFFPPIIFEDIRGYKNNKKRLQSYALYQKKHMNITNQVFYSNDEMKNICNQYDAFICGSDQIWNTSCTRGAKKPYYLNFAKDSNVLRMSYAPSIAHSTIDEKYVDDFVREIKNIQVLSIREETGKKLIKELTGRDAEVVLDPTLLLEEKDYDKLLEPLDTPKKYVYVYCLEYNKDIYDYAYKLAKEKGIELVYFRKYDIPKFKGALNSFPYGPGEFLYLIKNAAYVVTNSFHATVFSIIFGKRFTTFTTKRSASRMTDFLNKLGLDNRLYHENIDMDANIDYTKAYEKLAILKENSIHYLCDNLKEKLEE